jgi:membrane-associated protease RseP (regulator of RpoE activity)
VVREREIIDAQVAPAHYGPSADLKRALDTWPGVHYWVTREGPGRLVLIREVRPSPRERWWLHILLFVVTFVTVAAGGALLAPNAGPVGDLGAGSSGTAILSWFHGLRPGLQFAMAFMGILLAHESGHYFAARRYAINASPPYFIPAPWSLNLGVGTFGAFIRLRSPVADRRQLMDVGAAGPWAGFVVAMLFLVVGLQGSELLPASHGDAGLIIFFKGTAVPLGDSIITYFSRQWLVGDGTVQLNALALAGWFGLFVTTLNLLPLGQLDGGHILYALIGNLQGTVGRLAWLSLIPLGTVFYPWWIWAALILLFSRGRIVHPAVLDRHSAMPVSRTWFGWATIVLLILTFAPVPIHLHAPIQM